METLLQDLRFGIRSLLRTPRLTFAAFACIAIGIAATMSSVTLINAALIRQVPFPEPDRLVRVWATGSDENPRQDLSYPDFEDLRKEAESFELLEGATRTRYAMTTAEGTERMRGEAISEGYFELIGMRPALGRLFSEDEYAAGADRVMVIGDFVWKTTFGGDPEILGKTMLARSVHAAPEVSASPYTIIGVLPPGFVGTVEEDVSRFWIPVEHYTPRDRMLIRDVEQIWALARLKPGVSLVSAQAEVEAIGRQLEAAYPERRGGAFGMRVQVFGENWRSEIRTGLYLLLAASVMLLLIACTNIANLLLARLAKREHELSVRMVLGAGRRRILRQLLTESLTLAAAGGLAGVMLAYWGIQGLVSVINFDLPDYIEIGLDARLVLATLVVIFLTGIAFGVLPAWLGARLNLASQIRQAGRGATSGRRQTRFGQLLVVAEMALTFVLLVGASLMLRSYENLKAIDVGYRVENLLRMSIHLNQAAFPAPPDWFQFADTAQQTIESQPGVRRAAVNYGPLPPWADSHTDIQIDDSGDIARQNLVHAVDASFLETMGIELLHGRNFDTSDRGASQRVALISHSLAELVATEGRAQDAVERQIRFVIDEQGNTTRPYIVAGVVKDIKWRGPVLHRPGTHDVYLYAQQVPNVIHSFAIHTEVEPTSLVNPLRKVLGQLAPTSVVHWVSTMEEELSTQYADTRFYSALFSGYSLSAVVLAILGIYGVFSHSVVRRFNEIGVRMAFGAGRRDVLLLELTRGLRLAAIGIVIGVVVAIASSRVIASLLYGVSAQDVRSYVLVAVGLTVLALLASIIPARRAMQVDPAEALRQE